MQSNASSSSAAHGGGGGGGGSRARRHSAGSTLLTNTATGLVRRFNFTIPNDIQALLEDLKAVVHVQTHKRAQLKVARHLLFFFTSFSLSLFRST